MSQQSEGKPGSRRGLPVQPFPIEDPLASLPKTAQKILSAAQKLLAERGYDAVTLENVAAEAGVNKASIRYNFGNKAGLMTAVVDAVCHDEFVRGLKALPGTAAEDRAHLLIEGKRRLIAMADDFRVMFDVLPHVIRDQELSKRFWSSYPWWRDRNLQLLGLEGSGTGDRSEALTGLGQLITAVVDGLSIQALLNPDLDLRVPLSALELLLTSAMPRLRELAQGIAADGSAQPQATGTPAESPEALKA